MDRNVVEKLQAKRSRFIFAVIVSNYPPFPAIRHSFNGGFTQSFILPKMIVLWLTVFNKRPNNQS